LTEYFQSQGVHRFPTINQSSTPELTLARAGGPALLNITEEKALNTLPEKTTTTAKVDIRGRAMPFQDMSAKELHAAIELEKNNSKAVLE